MASDIKEAIRRLIYQYTVEGADKVLATQEAVAASTTKTEKASLSMDKTFSGLERRYVDTVRAQQDYAKVQDKVNAAVAQNPALQERANVVLAQAKQHFDNMTTGASKADMAATVLIRTMSRTIGPLAAVGVAVAAISSAMEFMEPIAVRVGKDIYDRFSQAHPEAARLADEIYKAGKAFVELERAQAKLEAIDAALKGTASSAELAALKMESLNEKFVNQRGAAEMAQAQERIANHVRELLQLYPGVTIETAKQLELLDAQLKVAQARTEEERQIAEQKLRQVELTQQGVKGEEQQLIIARKRAQAEADREAELRKDNVYYNQNATDATNAANKLAAAEGKGADQAARTGDEVERTSRHMVNLTSKAKEVAEVFTGITDSLLQWDTILEAIDHRLSELDTQFAGKQYVSSYDPLFSATQKAGLEKTYGAENVEPFYSGVGGALAGYRVKQDYLNSQQPTLSALSATDALQNFRDSQSKITDLINNLKDLTGSTDALNATMQNALSPYYSQDPRTTKLGFRAGVVGNPDWMVPGASNANPLAAVLGSGATAPGMANGGSFVVGGGYSANDNKIAMFPVASGEQVVVNRNRGGSAKVVNIDNRIIVNGAVDGDALSKLKVSRYQQTQRMRAGLARA